MQFLKLYTPKLCITGSKNAAALMSREVGDLSFRVLALRRRAPRRQLLAMPLSIRANGLVV